MLNGGEKRKDIARVLGITSKPLRAFCLAHGIERQRAKKILVPPSMVAEAVQYGEAYMKGVAQRMKCQGISWSIADEVTLSGVFLERIVSALQSYDTSAGASIKTYLTTAFEWALATHLSENLEREVVFLRDTDRIGESVEHGEPDSLAEVEYFIQDLNSPKRCPRPDDESVTAKGVPPCDVLPNPIEAILDGMRKPARRNYAKTQVRKCPFCSTEICGKPVTFSEPGGLAPDDSRSNPCPYCFGMGGISPIPYIKVGSPQRIAPTRHSPHTPSNCPTPSTEPAIEDTASQHGAAQPMSGKIFLKHTTNNNMEGCQ